MYFYGRMRQAYNGFLIVMGFPNDRIYMPEFWFKGILKLFGCYKDDTVKVGHSLALIVDPDGAVYYTDFGRYTTPKHKARARYIEEDPNVKVEVTADIQDNDLKNINAIVEAVYDMKHVTHCEGPLYYKVIPGANSQKAKKYAYSVVKRGYVWYNIFGKNSLNCTRYVQNLIWSCVPKSSLNIYYRYFCLFPTPIDNIYLPRRSSAYSIFEKGAHKSFDHGALDFLTFYFRRRKAPIVEAHRNQQKLKGFYWLDCEGTGSYFQLLFRQKIYVRKLDDHRNPIWEREYRLIGNDFSQALPFELHYGKGPNHFLLVQDGRQFEMIRN